MPPVVLPAVGSFDAKIYVSHDRRYDAGNPAETDLALMTDREVGAKILVEFTPDPRFELAAGNTISLVQIVRETIAKRSRLSLGAQGSEDAYLPRENHTGGFPLRTVTDGSADAGWLIDHQLFAEEQGVAPTDVARTAAIAQFAAARATAVQQLAGSPELPLAQGQPQIAFGAGTGLQAGRQVSNFRAVPHRRDLNLLISRLRGRADSASQRAVAAARAMIQYEYATRTRITLRNLDPRYAELRTAADAPRKARPAGNMTVLRNPTGDPDLPQVAGGELLLGHTFDAACDGRAWTTAVLSDEPTAPYKTADTLSGGMEFEVAALLETSAGGRRFVGSVRWGWLIDGRNAPVLAPPALTLGSADGASAAFFKAASCWNAMAVPDLAGATRQPVLALPSAIGQEFEKRAVLLDAALRGNDKNATTAARDRVLETWPTLPAVERTQSEGRMLGLLDGYEMKVNARRPSQLALRDQYQV